MKTQWVDEITQIYYNDYEEARDAVLEHMDADDFREALDEVIDKHGVNKFIRGLVNLKIGSAIYDEIHETAEQIVLSNYLVEVEDKEDEEE